jgi:DNA-binding NarL/FixJ family response regulator
VTVHVTSEPAVAAHRDVVRVLIVEDHKVVRAGLAAELAAPGFLLVGEAASGREAIAEAMRLQPDVVLLDLGLPDLPGPVVCAELVAVVPTVCVIVFSAHQDEALVRAVVEAGARAYLLKDAEDVDLPRVIERVRAGESVLDPRAASALLRTLEPGRRPAAPELTAQELNILRLVAEGHTNPEIGRRLCLSRHTVKEYLSNVMRKLDVASRLEAVLEGGRRGLIDLNAEKTADPPPASLGSALR